MTPLHYGAQLGHVEIVKALLEKGANTEARDKARARARERVENACAVASFWRSPLTLLSHTLSPRRRESTAPAGPSGGPTANQACRGNRCEERAADSCFARSTNPAKAGAPVCFPVKTPPSLPSRCAGWR